MILQTAQRKRAKIKMGLQGPSGSGKTMGALLIGFGLCGDWGKIAVIDSENHSAELYSDLGKYKVLQLPTPFTPETYIQALDLCEDAGMEVIIIDSLSHEWQYLLDFHASLSGNSFTNWSKITLRHDVFVQKILRSQSHIISTIRTKQDYVLVEKNGKMVPEKVGLKGIQRDSLDYEFTLVFDIDMKNHASASKDRTGLFFGKPEHRLSVETGKILTEWCNSGAEISIDDISIRINDCKSIAELLELYNEYGQFKAVLQPEFENQKRRILIGSDVTTTLSNQIINQNGTH